MAVHGKNVQESFTIVLSIRCSAALTPSPAAHNIANINSKNVSNENKLLQRLNKVVAVETDYFRTISIEHNSA